MPTGIEERSDAKGRKRYRGVVYSPAAGKRSGPWLPYLAAARSWRTQALGEIAAGTAARPDARTLRDEATAFFAGIESGATLARNGQRYKPATVRGYRRAWRRIDPELGAHRLGAIRRPDVQALVDRLSADGLAAGTVRNTLDPLRAIYRRALQRGRVAMNPTAGVQVPASGNGRDLDTRDRAELRALLVVLPESDRALWTTALYAGLRRGELRALRWADVDLGACPSKGSEP